jgi:hypothetical protein
MIKRSFWIILGVLVLLALTTTVVWAGGEETPPGQEGEVGADTLWTTLAPLIAIATSVERVLEILWERWEKAGVRPNWAGEPCPSAPDYVMKKKQRSHWLGTLIAVVAIGLTNVRFFRLLGFDVLFSSPDLLLFNAGIGGILDDFTVGTLIDWGLTAGIIGWGGTELTHNIIEGLIKGRSLWKEMREVESGEKSITDAKFFNDYIAPQLEERGVSVAMLRQAFQMLGSAGVPVDQLIGSMTTGKVDEFLGQLEAQAETAQAGQSVRTLLEGVPPEKTMEVPNVLNLLTPDLRQRFLGA